MSPGHVIRYVMHRPQFELDKQLSHLSDALASTDYQVTLLN